MVYMKIWNSNWQLQDEVKLQVYGTRLYINLGD